MKLVIMRGCSGSGKSTKAKQLMSDFLAENKGASAVICSADQFFMEDGEYKFNPRLLSQAHGDCKRRVKEAMKKRTDLIILDNTNTQAWEMVPYEQMSEKFGYETEKIVVGGFDEESLKLYASRNEHGVSLDIIKKQAGRFQK